MDHNLTPFSSLVTAVDTVPTAQRLVYYLGLEIDTAVVEHNLRCWIVVDHHSDLDSNLMEDIVEEVGDGIDLHKMVDCEWVVVWVAPQE